MRKGGPKFNYVIPALILVVIVMVGIALLTGGSDKPKISHQRPQTNQVSTSCGPYRKDGVVTVNGSQINVETAAGQSELTKGLSGRPCISSNWGMLFDFSREGHYAIWMKDMKFPIDVAWINSAHNVVAIEVDFQPSSYPERRINQTSARYVLEMSANKSKQLNMDIGTAVHFQKS